MTQEQFNAEFALADKCLICGDESQKIHIHKTDPRELDPADTKHRTIVYGLCASCFQLSDIYESVRVVLAAGIKKYYGVFK